MPLLEIKTGKVLNSAINEVLNPDYKWITNSKQYIFDWKKEATNEVFKIYLNTEKKEKEILGLVSLVDYPEEYRIHLNLIEVGAKNRGKNREIANIAGSLIAYACQLAFERDYFGFVSLKPKTRLINFYREKYGFQQYGRLLAVEQQSSRNLIHQYLLNEKE